MKLLIATLTLLPTLLFSQARYDANWVFGQGCGLHFEEDTVIPFVGNHLVVEACASISDSTGNLLFYLDFYINNRFAKIMINDSNIVLNGDSINASYSTTNGAVFLPVIEDKKYLLFHKNQANKQTRCPQSFCAELYYSVIENVSGEYRVTKKNISLGDSIKLLEDLCLIKHANGTGWWIITADHTDNCTNRFYRYLIRGDEILGPWSQDFGPLRCDPDNRAGETVSSQNGEYIAVCYTEENRVDLFTFDRCTGLLDNYQLVEQFDPSTYWDAYSCEFSPNSKLLYVFKTGQGGTVTPAELHQFNLSYDTVIQSKIVIWVDINRLIEIGAQLQLAPDNKIYHTIDKQFNNKLSTIHYPDSIGVACDFKFLDLNLTQGCQTDYGLPNFPNYNLGALSIYQANVFKHDTLVVCVNDTNIKGVLLGDSIAQANMQYYWQGAGITNPTNSYQFVDPDTFFTTYYLTLTDTTIKYSCQSRVDTVVVHKKVCGVGINEPKENILSIYPNPTQGNLTITSKQPAIIMLYDLTGRQVYNSIIPIGKSELSINHLHAGLYIYKVWVKGELMQSGKVVKVE